MKISACTFLFFILFSCQTKTAQQTENSDSIATIKNEVIEPIEEAMTFGFSNEKLNKVLTFEENTNPALFTQAIDDKGNLTPIKFIKTQKGNEGGVNQTSQNFDNCTGQVFETSDNKKFDSELSTIIINDEFIKNNKIVAVKKLEKPQKIDEKIKHQIATERNRSIKSAWKIADIDNQSAYIVEFTPKKDSVLASLIIGGNQFIYRDYPAIYDAGSTWRVDDGGEFPNDAITILAAFRNKNGNLELVTEWAGAEGANIEFIKANKNAFEIIKEASRYWGAY